MNLKTNEDTDKIEPVQKKNPEYDAELFSLSGNVSRERYPRQGTFTHPLCILPFKAQL